jgi:5'-nucleotidase / UDP-sugar diphosphatase
MNIHRIVSMTCMICIVAGTALSSSAPGDTGISKGEIQPELVSSSVPIRTTILFFNDIHGYLQPFTIKRNGETEEVGGIARLATLIREITDENRKRDIPTFVLLAGDILQGTPMSTVFKGHPDIECFNTMGVDAMTVGNHEFDFGVENFLLLKREARFPFLSANILLKKSGGRLCNSYCELMVTESVSIFIAGVTTKELLVTTRPSNVADLSVMDPVRSLEPVMTQLRSKGPFLLLSHCQAKTDEAIARAYPDLAAIIGGHDQILLNPHKQIGNVPIFQAGEKGRYLGRLDFWIDPATLKTHLVNSTYYPITADIKSDPVVEKIVETHHAKLDKSYKEVIGSSTVMLDGEREHIRYQETNLGNFVTDIMREYTGSQIALLNSGSLRASINPGDVTVEHVFQAMPYSNELVVVDITGAELLDILKRAVRGSRKDEDGGFLQVSGIRFNVDATTPKDIQVGESALDLKATYKTVITDFMSEGGDGYTVFTEKEGYNTRSPLRELIVDAFRQGRSVPVTADGRISRVIPDVESHVMSK